MNALRQTFAITMINLRSIAQRLGTSLVICVGIAGVVAVLTVVLAMATGLKDTLSSAARDDRAIVLRSGSQAEALSSLSHADLIAIEAAPGIRRAADGKPAISPETLLSVNLNRKVGNIASVSVRGLTPNGASVRPEIHLIEGRLFATGVHEVIVGKSAREQFEHLDVGDTAQFHNGDWKVVGVFDSAGDVHESEVIGDATTLMSAAQRTVYSAATVWLESPAAFDQFKEALKKDPTLKVDVQRESEYYTERSKQVSALLEIVANTVGAIMAIGALFGALNTMYSAVSTRAVEIATLRAIGFGAIPVVISVLAEAELLALIGAAAGGAIAWLFFSGNAFSTGGSLGQIAVNLHVGPALIAVGVVWAVVIGLIGGLFPAIRAARLSVSDALRVT